MLIQVLRVNGGNKVTGIAVDGAGHFSITLQLPAGFSLLNYKMSLFENSTNTPAPFSDSLGVSVTSSGWSGDTTFTLEGFSTPATTVDALIMLYAVELGDEMSLFAGSYGGTISHS